jgi:hypothetical protein
VILYGVHGHPFPYAHGRREPFDPFQHFSTPFKLCPPSNKYFAIVHRKDHKMPSQGRMTIAQGTIPSRKNIKTNFFPVRFGANCCWIRRQSEASTLLEYPWAYGNGWSWSSLSITRACHALPFYALGRATGAMVPLANGERALRLFVGWLAHKVGSVQPSSTPLDTPHRMPMVEYRLPLWTSLCSLRNKTLLFDDYKVRTTGKVKKGIALLRSGILTV